MKILKDCDLTRYSTMRLPSRADVMYVPESREELKNTVDMLKETKSAYHVLSAGSNVVFAELVKRPIVNVMEVDKSIDYMSDGRVKVGGGVRVQKLIRSLQKHEMGGIEYLFSVPTSIGGAVFMNAGRGKKVGISISDYLEEVEYYAPEQGLFQVYRKRLGDFGFRHSPFQNTDCIIVSATFRFKAQTQEETERLVKERMEHSQRNLSADKPSCGSVFSEGNRIVFRLLMGQRKGGAAYSRKTPDWINNLGGATASDVMALIEKGQRWHQWIGSKCRVEIKYFD